MLSKRQDALFTLQREIEASLSVVPVLALEWEWYLRDVVSNDAPSREECGIYLHALTAVCEADGIALHSTDVEAGTGQVEMALPPSRDAVALFKDALRVRDLIDNVAHAHGYIADFRAKPFADDYGSAIHVHVHVEDDIGNNLFVKQNDNLSNALRYTLGGLLARMPEDVSVFLPYAASWERIVPRFHAPVAVCWGYNNRTTMLRIPDGTSNVRGKSDLALQILPATRRIEHRLAGADADIGEVLLAVLRGVQQGLIEQKEPPAPIYGDASHEQYALMPLLQA